MTQNCLLASTTHLGSAEPKRLFTSQVVKEHEQGFSASPFQNLLYALHVQCVTSGGACRDRTDDPLLAKQVLSQLS